MRLIGAGPQMQGLARRKTAAVAEHRNDMILAPAKAQLQQRLRAGRLDHGDTGLQPFIGQLQMLGPDAIDHRLAVGDARHGVDRSILRFSRAPQGQNW